MVFDGNFVGRHNGHICDEVPARRELHTQGTGERTLGVQSSVTG